MECEAFYQHQMPFNGVGDRCSRNEIDAGTATQVSILGLSTTLCGIINLFVAGWEIRKWGPKQALVLQTLFPAIRVATQVVAVTLGGRTGIAIIQTTQLISILGGPAGYLLVLNTAAGEVVEPAARTGVFGQLQGSVMLGTAIGYLSGGIVGDAFGIRRPFDAAFFLFVLSSLYAALFIPYISPDSMSDGKAAPIKGVAAFFGPLKVLLPQRLQLGNGRIQSHWGIIFLALGVFTGVLATGYAPLLIQMYATAVFNFRPTENGYLMSVNSLIRGFFLIFLFPRIIKWGRGWYVPGGAKPGSATAEESIIPTDPDDFDPIQGIMPEQEPAKPLHPVDLNEGCEFDLFFLRWSLVADGLVTAGAAFASKGWHIYLVGFLLPLASGSAPASKGVITEMCPSSRRADALQAMTLVENVAMLSTLGVFGFVFAAFSDIGKAYLTFFCNAVSKLSLYPREHAANNSRPLLW